MTVPSFEPIASYSSKLFDHIKHANKNIQQINWCSEFSFAHSSLWTNCPHEPEDSFDISSIMLQKQIINTNISTRTKGLTGKQLYEYWQTVKYWNNGYVFMTPKVFNIRGEPQDNQHWQGSNLNWIKRWVSGESRKYDSWLGLNEDQQSIHMWMGLSKNSSETDLMNKFVNKSIYQAVVKQLEKSFVQDFNY